MKIAFLSRYQDVNERGAETFVKELAKRLSKNHQVNILSGDRSDSRDYWKKGEYDVVVPINGAMQSLKASLGRKIGGYKILISGHSGIGRDDLWNILITRPDMFVALTDKMFSWAKKWSYGVKVIKINNGVDLTKFVPKGDKIDFSLERPIVLSVGSLSWYKHHEKTIDAVSRLKKASLVIVGKGEEEKRLKALGRRFLKERFLITNFSYVDMPKVYRSVDLFTLPSWDREAFGIVYLEALASNLAVVGPNDSSRQEIVGSAGILTNVDDSSSYSNALTEALERDWGNLPREQAKKFDWDKVASEYEVAMSNLIKK